MADKCSACGGGKWLRGSFWHGPHLICGPCFIVWYEYMDTADDGREPELVGKRSLELKAAGKFPWTGEYASQG